MNKRTEMILNQIKWDKKTPRSYNADIIILPVIKQPANVINVDFVAKKRKDV